jgi:hypothetical protein
VMLRVTAGVTSAAAAASEDEEGEKEEYFRSLPRPWSGRGPATVSSQSWSRRPMPPCCAQCDGFRVRMLRRMRVLVVKQGGMNAAVNGLWSSGRAPVAGFMDRRESLGRECSEGKGCWCNFR